MAVIDRAFGSVLLYGMDYHQTSQPFLQRTDAPGTVDASLLGSSLSQINSVPMDSGLNSNGSYYMHNQFNAHPSPGAEHYSLFAGGAAQSPAGIPAMSPITHTCHSGRSRKHRLQEGTDNNPLKKRRLSASSTPLVFQEPQAPDVFARGSGQPFWSSSDSQVKADETLSTVADQSSAMMQPIATEEMEDLAVESQSDAALRRIRDIESRLVEEDEEEEDENNSIAGHLPTLVMSDVLVEGFKKGLDDELTKKIVESINRPSMELVLWKPQPEFLVNKLQSIASSYKTDKQVARKMQRTPATPLLQELNPSGVDKPCTANLDCPINSMWNREEEEMEL